MHQTYKSLLKNLHKKYPKKHICISPTYNYYTHSKEYKAEYLVYVEDAHCGYFPTLKEVKIYVKRLCEKET